MQQEVATLDASQGCLAHLPNNRSQLELPDQYQFILRQVMERSEQEQIVKNYSITNGLAKKYRKMILNMKMRKSNQSCTICMEKFVEDQIIKQLPCKHILHRECAKKWLKINKSCPICRSDLETSLKIKEISEKMAKKEQST